MTTQITTQSGKSVKVEVFGEGHTIYTPTKNFLTKSEYKFVKQQAKKISPMSKLHWLSVAQRGIATWELHINGENVAKILFSLRKGYNGKMDKMPIMGTRYIPKVQAEKLGWFNRGLNVIAN